MPIPIGINTRALSPVNSNASGIRCKKAVPNRVPEEKATNMNITFFKLNSLKPIIPIKEIKLTNIAAVIDKVKSFTTPP